MKIITDKNEALIAVKQDGLSLMYTSERLQDNEKIVKIAVSQNGEALEYASDRLRDDVELQKLTNN